MCRVPARVAPPPVFQVSPHLLEHGIDDVVHASVDESCILVEKFSDRSLDSDFSRTITACFLLTAILNFLLFSIAILPKLLPGKKARLVCRRAGATHASLGRLKAEKVGSLPPNLTFFHGRFRFCCDSISLPIDGFPSGEVKNGLQKK
jgi:hypothetical protein